MAAAGMWVSITATLQKCVGLADGEAHGLVCLFGFFWVLFCVFGLLVVGLGFFCYS